MDSSQSGSINPFYYIIGGLVVVAIVAYFVWPKKHPKKQHDKKTDSAAARMQAAQRLAELRARHQRPQRLASDQTNGNGSGTVRYRAHMQDTAGRGYLGQPGTIWATPLEEHETGRGIARASTGTWQKGARVNGVMGGKKQDPHLFNYTDAMDPLSAADAKVEDLFPMHDHAKAKDSNDAIGQLYTWDNFRAAQDRNSRQGFLRPQLDRTGWSKLGARNDYGGWLQTTRWLRDQLGSKENIKKFQEDLMVPVPEQFMDLSYNASYERGIVPRDSYEGIGGVAVRQLADDLQREKDGMPTADRHARGEVAREVHQNIPTQDARAAVKVMRDIRQAMEKGNQMGYPQLLSSDQLQTVSDWIHSQNTAA